jgi:hypothetical protein
LNYCISRHSDFFVFSRSNNFYFLNDISRNLFPNNTLHFLDDLFDFFAADLDIERLLNLPDNFLDLFIICSFESPFTGRNSDGNFLLVLEMDNLGHFNDFWSSD